jgi:hypothetical protein
MVSGPAAILAVARQGGAMLHARITWSTLSAAVAVAAFAPFAAATGEPKNEAPFTHVVQAPYTHVVTAPAMQFGSAPPTGESKSQLPFTRPVAATSSTTFVVRRSDGFDWADAAIGAVFALGASAAAVGAVIVVRGHEGRGAARA